MTTIRYPLAVVVAASAVVAPVSVHPQPRASSTVPFRLVVALGNPRPIVTARFNGHVMPMMIHSNASFYAQLKHAQAAAFDVRLVGDHRTFGIDRPGHVSALGQDRGVVRRLVVGDVRDRDAPVSVFETPQDRYGMLGIDWITRHRLILDYARHKALISPATRAATALGDLLRRTGYVALPMSYDAAEQRFVLAATVNGVTRKMNVATASEFGLDSEFARLAHVATGADDGHGSGPTGTHVPRYSLARPIRVRIGSWTSPPIAEGRVQDNYGYNGERRPADPTAANGGDLGGPFLVATGAIVDFGSRILYVRAT